ncbi:transcription termination/antitermination NusG family protein [Shinella zoogloeoides]|uniref:transcription termination/antitermination protein NusG n=1 Tax=Shinella zoogloeoides TaxID=352475 RepID=UPI0028B0D8D2|nr:transcription termination/antitermination NusG family protein [Shinella zoogloeoides]
MQTTQETVTILDTIVGHAVVIPDSLAGWRMVDDGFTADQSLAAIRAAGIENARILPAVQEKQEVCRVTTDTSTRFAVMVDWQALPLVGRKEEYWYAVRVAPGAQRMASRIPDAPEYRVGETLVERNLREAGIDVYMPAYWREFRPHRGGKVKARRLPFLIGYAFIRRDPGAGFKAVTEIDGVLRVVSVGDKPARFAEDEIRFLMLTMFDRHQAFLYHRAHKIEEARFKRKQTLNAELGRHLPKGRDRKKMSTRAHADACINSLPETARRRILGIISDLDRLDADETLDDFREAVYFPARDD